MEFNIISNTKLTSIWPMKSKSGLREDSQKKGIFDSFLIVFWSLFINSFNSTFQNFALNSNETLLLQ